MILNRMPYNRTYDFAGFDSPARRHQWQTALQSSYFPFDVDISTKFGSAHIESFDVAQIRVGYVESDAMRIQRRQEHIDSEPVDAFMLPMPADGTLTLTQGGRQTTTAASTIAFVETTHPYEYIQPTHNQIRTLRMSGAALRARVPNPDRLTATTFDEESNPIVPLVTSYIRSFCSIGSRLSVTTNIDVENCLYDLFGLLLDSADATTDSLSIRQAHRQRAIECVEANYRDTEFGPRDVASAINLSDRYLQKILAEEGTTVSHLISTRRMNLAKELLASPRNSTFEVGVIAQLVGYTDAAYFSRVFKKETGESPTSYRRNRM